MKPYINDLSAKQRIPIQSFEGINTGISPLLINDGQAEDMKNLDTRDFPLLKTRESREEIATLTGEVKYLGTLLGETLTVIEDTTWNSFNFTTSEWTNIKTGVTGSGKGNSIEFVDYTIYVNGTTNVYKKHGSATTGTFSTMPNVTALASANSKLYGIEENKLHHSGIRDPNVWADGENSGYIVIETPNGEELSAITEYGGHIMCFKPHSTHKLFGMYYGDHNLQIVSDSIGCVSQKSICKVQTQLIWLGDKAVYMYDTSTAPIDISLPIKKYIDNGYNVSAACAGTDGERYYLSLPQKDNGHVLLVYDTRIGIWNVEDDKKIIDFTTAKNTLYGVDSTGHIYKMISDETETFDWHWSSKWFSSGTPSMKQNWFSAFITLKLGEGSTFKAEVINNKGQSADVLNTIFESVGDGYAKVVRVMIPSTLGHNSDWLQIKLSGTGYCKIHNIERELRIRKGSY